MDLTFGGALIILGSVTVTAFLSGIFGMAGGMILKSVLLALVPVAAAMVLHGLVQIVSNGWRAFLWRRHIAWGLVGKFALGMVPVIALFAWTRFNPPAALVYFGLGLLPFINEATPKSHVPPVDQKGIAYLVGGLVTFVQLLAGVAGPVLDVFFLRAKLDRRGIVATKAATQVLGHAAKIGQFGVILSGLTEDRAFPLWLPMAAVPLSILGTNLAAPVLERLTDKHFRNGMRFLLLTTGLVNLITAAWIFWV